MAGRLAVAAARELKFDVLVVGGGIVGCATARQFLVENPALRVALIEKEPQLASHQSGHNSGVIHAGIYYTPGTLKAKLCLEGYKLMYDYCAEKGVAHRKTGKLIVATRQDELPRLQALFERAQQNGCPDIELIDGARISEFEPYCKGIRAIWSPHTGIADYAQVTRSYAEDVQKSPNGRVFLSHPLRKIVESGDAEFPLRVESDPDKPPLLAARLLTCAGLQSDRVTTLTGETHSQTAVSPAIVPVRGEYLELRESSRYLIRGNIYPVPDPSLPFLGVHFTPRIDGRVLLGPNAVPALARESYSKGMFGKIDLGDLKDAVRYGGTLKLANRHRTFLLGELYRSWNRKAQLERLRRYIPELKLEDLQDGPVGVRAQALDQDGRLVDDFVFESALQNRVLHVRNAPSPGATSSLAIARHVVQKARKDWWGN